MKKYIKTNSGIYESKKYWKKPPIEIMDINEEIICQADTIEELCDELVVIYKNNEKFKKPFTSVYDNLKDLLKEHDINECKIYGAIWTNKGLIYAAKMNDKGELELI